MKMIKPPSVAGQFYPESKEELLSQLKSFEEKSTKEYNYNTRAIIAPHAGYIYSGQLASDGFKYLDKNIKNVFIISPAHSVRVDEIATSSSDYWQTPIGEIALNKIIQKELIEKFDCIYSDEAFKNEHSLEVQVPFIQKNLNDVQIIPIIVGGAKSTAIADILEYYWKNPENGFVISSDLSHFYTDKEATKIDSVTADMIENNNIDNFDYRQACGSTGICGLIKFAQKNDYSLIRVGLTNSAQTSGDTSRVVGYGSWFLYEKPTNSFIKEFYSKFAKDVCKKSIEYGLKHNKLMPTEEIENIPYIFNQLGACFVTLEINEELRGCIGSIIAHRSLIDDLIYNAYNSAFSDTRFLPLSQGEFEDVTIAISLLSSPKPMSFKDEEDLLIQIQPFVDGIIIKDGYNQSVYLPSVWEQLPNKTLFLNSLKQKAGLSPNHFSKSFEAHKFYTEYIK